MELDWKSPNNLVAIIDGRALSVVGVALIEGDVNYLILPRQMTKWHDGTPLSLEERDAIVREVVAVAHAKGWNFQVRS
jgi:hypothetical protein